MLSFLYFRVQLKIAKVVVEVSRLLACFLLIRGVSFISFVYELTLTTVHHLV